MREMFEECLVMRTDLLRQVMDGLSQVAQDSPMTQIDRNAVRFFVRFIAAVLRDRSDLGNLGWQHEGFVFERPA